MKNMTNLKELKAFIKTPEAFQGEFTFKGFGIWWSEYDVRNTIQGTEDGYFRCDPCNDKQYNDFHKLEEKMFGGFEWVLS